MSDLSGLAEALIGGDPERLFRLGEVEAVNPGPPRTLTVDGRQMRYLFRASVTDVVLYIDEGNDPFVLGKLSDGDDGVPIGIAVPFLGAVADMPPNYLFCDGRSTSGFPLLAAMIGTNTPDLRGRTLVGAGGTYALGARGGASAVSLTVAQLPAHDHSLGANSVSHSHGTGSHSHGIGTHSHSFSGSTGTSGFHSHSEEGSSAVAEMAQGGATYDVKTLRQNTGGAGDHSHSVSGSVGSTSLSTGTASAGTTGTQSSNHTHDVGATGSGSGHENMPPFHAVNYMVRAA